jgi:heat shock protein HslJ
MTSWRGLALVLGIGLAVVLVWQLSPLVVSRVDLEGEWHLVGGVLDGKPIPLANHQTTLRIDSGQVSGRAACNGYDGTITVRGSAVTVGEIFQTLVACLDNQQMASEQAYMTAFRRVTAARRAGDILTLSGSGAELRYSAAPP